MFAADRGWLGRITEAVQSGLTAEAAVQKIREETRTRMMQMADPYLRERLLDLEDLANRLQHFLAGGLIGAEAGNLPPEFILVAQSMGPAELLDYAHRRVRGLVLEEGSPTAHVAIVARAFDIPVIGRVEDATSRIEAWRYGRRRRRSCPGADPTERGHSSVDHRDRRARTRRAPTTKRCVISPR
jgi:phosphotransferase system enzyme I (PtsP)